MSWISDLFSRGNKKGSEPNQNDSEPNEQERPASEYDWEIENSDNIPASPPESEDQSPPESPSGHGGNGVPSEPEREVVREESPREPQFARARVRRNWFGSSNRIITKTTNCPYCFTELSSRDYEVLEKSQARRYRCTNESCNRILPPDIFDVRLVTVALIGRMRSGKTCFTTTMLREWLSVNRYFINRGYLAEFEDEKSEEKFRNLEDEMYVQTILPDATQTKKAKTPFVLRLINRNKVKEKQILLSIFDIPGEEFRDTEKMIEEWPHLYRADAMIFLLDPLNLPGIHKDAKEYYPEIHDDLPYLDRFQEDKILGNLFKILQQKEPDKHQRLVKKPLAVCLTKTDVLDKTGLAHFYPESDIDLTVYRAKGHLLREIKQQSEDVADFLNTYAPQIVAKTSFHFNPVMYFPVSPLGEVKIKGARLDNPPEPQGVLQPVFWALHEMGFMKI